MSLLKNGLALVGLFVIAREGYKAYGSHLKEPLERKMADLMDEEGELANRIRLAAVAKERENVIRKVRECVYRAGSEAGLADDANSKLADRVRDLFIEEIDR